LERQAPEPVENQREISLPDISSVPLPTTFTCWENTPGNRKMNLNMFAKGLFLPGGVLLVTGLCWGIHAPGFFPVSHWCHYHGNLLLVMKKPENLLFVIGW
jgi:hypothetical protein